MPAAPECGPAAAVGAGLAAAVAKAFRFRFAADTGRLVDLALATPGTGSDLPPLLDSFPAPAGPRRSATRHRLDCAAFAAPVSPPL